MTEPSRWWRAGLVLVLLFSFGVAATTCEDAVAVAPEEAGVPAALAALFSLSSVSPPTGQPGFTATVLQPVWIPDRAYILDIRLQRSRSIASLQTTIGLLIAQVGPQIGQLLGAQKLAIVITTGLYGSPHGYYVLSPADLAAGRLPAYSTYTIDERDVVAWLQEFRKFLLEVAPIEPTSAHQEYVPGVGAFVALSPDVLSSTAASELGTCAAWVDLLLCDTARGVGQLVAERVRDGEVLAVETLLETYSRAYFVIQAGEYTDIWGWEVYVD